MEIIYIGALDYLNRVLTVQGLKSELVNKKASGYFAVQNGSQPIHKTCHILKSRNERVL